MTPLAKVCGLTRAQDAAFAAARGADLLGFVAHPSSPRHCLDLALARPFLDRGVLVVVASSAEEVLALAQPHGFRRVQPHLPAAERSRAVAQLRRAGFWILLPWADEAGQEAIPADLYLWEPSPARTGLAGGSGLTHAMAFPPPGPYLLAGGLDGTNLAERRGRLPLAVAADLRGFDAASRLEASPGVKDPLKVTAFVQAAHLEFP